MADFGVTMVVLHLLGVLFGQVFFSFPETSCSTWSNVFGRSEDTAKRKVTVATSVFCGLGNASPIERIDLLKTVPKTIIFPLEIVPPIRKHEFSKPYFSGASC